MDKLPDETQTTIRSLVKPALAKLKELAGKVLALAGVGDKIKSVLDSITTERLNATRLSLDVPLISQVIEGSWH
jgi:hypothetical protein